MKSPTHPISPNNNFECDGMDLKAVDDREQVHPVESEEESTEIPVADSETDEAMKARRVERAARRSGTAEEWDAMFPTAAPADAQERFKVMPQPVLPSRKERERHNLCHYPFASWC